MSITTLDGLIAGLQTTRGYMKASTSAQPLAGHCISLWAQNGIPGPGSYSSSLNGVVLSSSSGLVSGQIPFYDPVSGNTYLARFTSCCASGVGRVFLLDRLWHNGGYSATSTSAQNSTTPVWPARDNSGSTDGEGVQLLLEISASMGAAAPSISVSYTNSAGASGRTATLAFSTYVSPLTNTTFPFTLQDDDKGVRSVQSLTLGSSWLSGTMNLVAYRHVAVVDATANNSGFTVSTINGGLPQMFNGSVPYLMYTQASNSGYFMGTVTYAQG